MAPKKKHASVRARRNVASTAATLREQVDVIIPPLPEFLDEEGNPTTWSESTIEWWEDLWSAPMSAEYHSSDRHQLFVLAKLMDQFWKDPSPARAAEIRLQRKDFGVTPLDRRRLEWTSESAEEAKDRGDARRGRSQAATPPPAAANDPRLALVQ